MLVARNFAKTMIHLLKNLWFLNLLLPMCNDPYFLTFVGSYLTMYKGNLSFKSKYYINGDNHTAFTTINCYSYLNI